MALAQHQGIPTRLLDWTAHAYYAAYFAAVGVVSTADRSGCLEVWALRLRPDGAQQGVIIGKDNSLVQLVSAPRVTSRNQNAQRGLFTVTEYPGAGDQKQRDGRIRDGKSPVSVDEVIREPHPSGAYELPLMYRLSLPQQRGGELLWHLARIPVDGSIMFPGLEGVSRVLQERKHYKPRGL